MMREAAAITGVVDRCVARHDGAYWIVTRDNAAAVATSPIPVGAQVLIRDGRAQRAAR